MTQPRDEWITMRQAANTLGVSVQRVHQLVLAGTLAHRRSDPKIDGTNGRPRTIHISRNACLTRLRSPDTGETR